MRKAQKVLVVEPNDRRAHELGEFLKKCGYEPVVHIVEFDAEVWDWVADTGIIGVVTYYVGHPFSCKRQDLQDIVDIVRPGLPVLAICPDSQGSLYFDSESHSCKAFNFGEFSRLVAEHLQGTCAICAWYRS